MASNDEGQGSSDCDDVYRAADDFFSLADIETDAETQTCIETEIEIDGETQTGIETGAETGAASGNGVCVEPKAKRQ